MSNVNHPNHYNIGSIEVIEAIEDWKLGFNTGNAIKYISRAKYKGKELEDLEKAKWYLDREISRLKTEKQEEPPWPRGYEPKEPESKIDDI